MWSSAVGVIVTLTLSMLVAPLASNAQRPVQVPVIGMLIPSVAVPPSFEAFRQGLHDLGYVEGQNIALEYRFAGGLDNRLPELAADLIRLKVDIIVTFGTPATKAAQQATKTIPIVVGAMGDPVEMGLVSRLARPGGNITGLSTQVADLAGKRLALLKEAVPQASRVAVLWNAASPNKVLEWKETEIAAQALGVTLQSVEVRTPDDFARAFSALTRGRADALITFTDGLTITHGRQIVDFTTQNRLPMMSARRDDVEAGGLMAFGPSFADLYRRAAAYVDKILKGAKPGDLPVEQPMKFEVVINLKTAKALGLTIPPTLLFQADKVIQ